MDSVLPVLNTTSNVQSSPSAVKTLGKDEFLQLLVTKLQHQDPLQPMADEDFIAQLAQFSSLEQMHNIAAAIAESNQLGYLQTQSLNNAMAAGFVGKDVKVVCSGIYMDADNTACISYTTDQFAATVQFIIRDEQGNRVATLTRDNVGPGSHPLTWDGTDDLGSRVPEGRYTVEAIAADATGAAFEPSLSLIGTVEAVIYRDGVAYLRVEGVEIPLGDVTAIGEQGAFDDEDQAG
jgi:flagellar basal-body rod modification protein FlgD